MHCITLVIRAVVKTEHVRRVHDANACVPSSVDVNCEFVSVDVCHDCHRSPRSPILPHESVPGIPGISNNRVGLVDLPNITALAFIPSPSLLPDAPSGPPEGADGPPPLKVLAGTAQHKLWLYDLKAGRRPQMDLAWGEAKITALAPEPDGE